MQHSTSRSEFNSHRAAYPSWDAKRPPEISSIEIAQMGRELSHAEVRMLILLAQYDSNGTAWSWISQAELADQMGVRPRRVREIVAALWDKNWITTAIISDTDEKIKRLRHSLLKSGVKLDGRHVVYLVHRPEDAPPDEWREKLRPREDFDEIPF